MGSLGLMLQQALQIILATGRIQNTGLLQLAQLIIIFVSSCLVLKVVLFGDPPTPRGYCPGSIRSVQRPPLNQQECQ